MSTLVIPDVHGRRFWLDAVTRHPDTDTIFLGDYLDPYPFEKISPLLAIDNFRSILDHARNHRECHLLLGNHDLHYLCDFGEACRLDYANYALIAGLLRDNLDLFSLVALRDIGGKKVAFSHSGILRSWVEAVGETSEPELLAEHLNALVPELLTDPGKVARILGHISEYRGGYDPFGSPVWADLSEIRDLNLLAGVDFSVFGHTQQSKNPVISARWACLDCRRAFIVAPGDGSSVSICEC